MNSQARGTLELEGGALRLTDSICGWTLAEAGQPVRLSEAECEGVGAPGSWPVTVPRSPSPECWALQRSQERRVRLRLPLLKYSRLTQNTQTSRGRCYSSHDAGQLDHGVRGRD